MKALPVLLGAVSMAHAQTDWPVYGHDPGGMRYSPLKRITAKNVANLSVAWTYDTQEPAATPPANVPSNEANQTNRPANESPEAVGPGRGGRGGGARTRRRLSESTPLVIGGVMYLSTAYNRVLALEPETGKKIWE